ncbi:MAG: aspartyl protease family protein [Janthinobacterium lividum]
MNSSVRNAQRRSVDGLAEKRTRRYRLAGGLSSAWLALAILLCLDGATVATASGTVDTPAAPAASQDAPDQSKCDQPSPAPPAGSTDGGVTDPSLRLKFTRGTTSSGWLPFEYFAGNRVFVPIKINGRAVLALLDSGASETVIDTSFARAAGLTPKGKLTGQGEAGSTTYGTVEGVDIKLGDAHWSGGTPVAIDLAAVARQLGHPVPVILGGEIFKASVVDLDFGAHRIAFRRPFSYAAPVGAHEVPLTAAGEIRAITATVEGRPATLVFDLGNAGAIDLYPRFWEQSAFKARKTSTVLVGGVGGMSVQKTALLGDISLGSGRFQSVPARLENSQYSQNARCGKLDGNIGMGILSRFRLIVDFPGNKVLFARPIDTDTLFPVNHAGVTLRPGEGTATVLYIAPGSPADRAGLKAGAKIDSVDGQPVAAGKSGDWQFGPVGKVIRLHLTNGEEKDVVLARYF